MVLQWVTRMRVYWDTPVASRHTAGRCSNRLWVTLLRELTREVLTWGFSSNSTERFLQNAWQSSSSASDSESPVVCEMLPPLLHSFQVGQGLEGVSHHNRKGASLGVSFSPGSWKTPGTGANPDMWNSLSTTLGSCSHATSSELE